MTLRPLSDVSPGDWLVNTSDHDDRVITRGPSGFAAYVRVLHSWLDNEHEERREGCLDDEQLHALAETLTLHTRTPDRCFNALWDGFGDIDGGPAAGFLTSFSGSTAYSRLFRHSRSESPPPAFPQEVLTGPRLQLVPRSYLLFGGPLAEAGRWGAKPYDLDVPRDINSPNLLWPEDRAWFLATDVNQFWTGIAGSKALAEALLSDDRLEVIRAGDGA